MGTAGAGGGAAAPRPPLSDLRGVSGVEAGRSAVRASAAGAAGRGRAGEHGRRSAERGARCGLREGPAKSALGGNADRRVSLGAHRPLQGVPRDDPAAQDPLACEEGRQARATDDGAERGERRCRVRDRGRHAPGGRQPRAAARARPAGRRRHDEPIRCAVPPLPGHHDDAGSPPRRPRRAIGRGDDRGRGRRTARQGVPPPDGAGAAGDARGAGGSRHGLR